MRPLTTARARRPAPAAPAKVAVPLEIGIRFTDAVRELAKANGDAYAVAALLIGTAFELLIEKGADASDAKAFVIARAVAVKRGD